MTSRYHGSKTITLHVASRFFVHFLAVVARFLISRARFMQQVDTTQKFPFPFLNCDMVLPDPTPENVANI